MAEPTRVVLADDDVLLRAGLAGLLEGAGFEVVGQADDGGQLLNLVRAMTPDLVVTDIRMPPTNTSEGLDAARQIREELPGTAIMVLSAHIAVDDAMDLLAAGDRIGYLRELVSARKRDDPLSVLSERESEVLASMAESRSNAVIAHRIWVTEARWKSTSAAS